MSNERAVRVEWTGAGMQFRGGGTNPVTPEIVVDGDGVEGPSPMLTLLLAAAGCTGSDIVDMFPKMRVTLTSLRIDVTGTRREEHPRRYVALRLRFTLAGDGLDRARAERAVALSLEKYCSVVRSLAPDIRVDHEITLV